MSDDLERMRALESLFRPAGDYEPAPYLARSAGTLTPAMLDRFADELWRREWPPPPGGYRGGREPFGTVPVTVRPPEWTVEADGCRLVIRDGAIIGLECD